MSDQQIDRDAQRAWHDGYETGLFDGTVEAEARMPGRALRGVLERAWWDGYASGFADETEAVR